MDVTFISGAILTQENLLRLIKTFTGPKKIGVFSIGSDWYLEIGTYFGNYYDPKYGLHIYHINRSKDLHIYLYIYISADIRLWWMKKTTNERSRTSKGLCDIH